MRRLILLFAFAALASATQYYVDNSCSNNGNGLATNCASAGGGSGAYSSIVNVPSGSYSAGNTILLKRGQTYRETMTIPASGAVGNPIIIDAWGTGASPIIKGSSLATGWTTYTTSNSDTTCSTHTYQAAFAKAATPQYVWRSGTFLTQGTGQDALTDQQWFWAANVLYFCDGGGSPLSTGALMEASNRINAIVGTARSYITIQNVSVQQTESYAIRASTSSTNWTVSNVLAYQVAAFGEFPSAVNLAMDHITLNQGYSTVGGIVLDGTSAASVAISQYACIASKYCLAPSNTNGGTAITLNGCLFDQYSTTPIAFSTPGVVNVSNCVVPGTSTATPAETFKASTGTLNVDYSLVLPDSQNTLKALFSGAGAVEGSHNIYDEPQWTSTGRTGVFGRTVDDGPDCPDWLTLNATANRYGLPTTLALSQTDRMSQNFLCGAGSNWGIVQAQINAGHDIVSHTRYHSNVGYNNVCCWITFTGTASTATMTISGNVLTTRINGTLDLTINLAQTNLGSPPSQLRESDLCAGGFASGASSVTSALGDLSSYQCVQAEPLIHTAEGRGGTQDFNDKVLIARALPVTNVDINHTTATSALTALSGTTVSNTGYGVYFDADAVQADELTTAAADIRANLTAPNDPLTPYNLNGFNYPGGYYSCLLCATAPIQQLINNGILGARADGMQAGGRLTSSMNIYTMSTGFNADGKQYQLPFEQSCADSTGTSNFTCTGITYSNDHVRQIYSGKFNGSAFASHAAGALNDFHRGDFLLRVWVKPTSLTATHTLYFNSTDDSNYVWAYITSTGSVVLSVEAGGVEVVHAATPAGSIVTGVDGGAGSFQEVLLWKRRGVYHIQVNAVELATVASRVNPVAYTGTAYWGVSHFSGTTQNGYVGLMDDVAASVEGYMRAASALLGLTQTGAVQMDLSHGESPGPSVLYRNVFEAKKAFTGNTLWLSMSGAIAYLRSKGTMQADNQTLVWVQPDASNYRPRMGSPVCGAGTTLGSATDLDGLPYLRNDIGPYRCAPKTSFGGVM